MKYQAAYWRHYSFQIQNFETLEDAIEYLELGSDYNDLSSVGVFVDGKLFWRSETEIQSDDQKQKEYDEFIKRKETPNKLSNLEWMTKPTEK